jgi:hypothetical protein
MQRIEPHHCYDPLQGFGGSSLCIIILLWRLEPLHYHFALEARASAFIFAFGGSSVQKNHNDLRRSSSLFIILYHSWLLFSDPVVAERQERDSLAIERGDFRLCMSMLFMRQNLEKKKSKDFDHHRWIKNSRLTPEISSFPTETQMNNLEICKS